MWIPIAPIHKGDEDPKLHKPINFMEGQQLEMKCYALLSKTEFPFFNIDEHEWRTNCVVKEEDSDRLKELLVHTLASAYNVKLSDLTNVGGGGSGAG